MKSTFTALMLMGAASASILFFDAGTFATSPSGSAGDVLNPNTNVTGRGNSTNATFQTMVVFDISNASTRLGEASLSFNVLSTVATFDDLTIEYIGSYASGDLTNANGAIWEAASGTTIYSDQPGSASSITVNFDSNIIDLNEDYAVFRFRDPSPISSNNQFITGAFALSVPEPSSLALLGLGGLAIASRRRR